MVKQKFDLHLVRCFIRTMSCTIPPLQRISAFSPFSLFFTATTSSPILRITRRWLLQQAGNKSVKSYVRSISSHAIATRENFFSFRDLPE